jgi:protein-S-isoprenylcysteine O-methyltransferase Ste14
MLAMLMGLDIRYTSPRSFLLPILGQNALTASIFFACTAPTLSLVRRIKQEEAMLEEEFGAEWKTYCKKTWRLVPFIW